MKEFIIFSLVICITGFEMVDSQCAGGQHTCYATIAGKIASVVTEVDGCSKEAEYKGDITSCRGLITSDCPVDAKQPNLDALKIVEDILTNFTSYYCGSGDCSDIFNKLLQIADCNLDTYDCAGLQAYLGCIEGIVGTCDARIVKESIQGSASSICPICQSANIMFQGKPLCEEGAITIGGGDLEPCYLALGICFAQVPDLITKFAGSSGDTTEICRAYNDIGASQATQLNNCINSAPCPEAPPPGQPLAGEHLALFGLKALGPLCECPMFESKIQECASLEASLARQSNADCSIVEQLACCVKPLVTECPDLWYLALNPPGMIAQGDTLLDATLRRCNIDPKRIEGDSISGDKCSSIYTGSGSNKQLNFYLVVGALVLLVLKYD